MYYLYYTRQVLNLIIIYSMTFFSIFKVWYCLSFLEFLQGLTICYLPTKYQFRFGKEIHVKKPHTISTFFS